MRCEEPCYADPTLFVMADEALIESAENATFSVCPMVKAPEPVLRPTEPWEGGDGADARPVHSDPITGSVLYDPREQRFHLWYSTHTRTLRRISPREAASAPEEASWACRAVSSDGLAWEKPRIGAVSYNQSYENNMIRVCVPPIKTQHLSGVLPNYVPDFDAALVATMYSHFDDPVYPRGITFMLSRDGVEWEPHFPPPLPLDGDAHCLMWDPQHECYICTTRSYVHAHEVTRLQLQGFHHLRNKRHIAVARSRDLIHWTPMLPVLEADDQDPPNAQLYYMYVIPYGHGYVGLVQLFYMQEQLMTYGPLEMQLTFSRDLVNWTRVGDRTPILPRGPQGTWDQAHVSISTNPPHPEGDRLRFWYGGKDTEHWQAGVGGFGTATLRRDGFACYEAGDAEAVVTTAPLLADWATWPSLNVDATGGEARVEIVDADTMQPLEGTARDDCLPIVGDHLMAMATYGERRGTFVRHSGKIRFRFHLRNARLYAFKAPNVRFPDTGRNAAGLWL